MLGSLRRRVAYSWLAVTGNQQNCSALDEGFSRWSHLPELLVRHRGRL